MGTLNKLFMMSAMLAAVSSGDEIFYTSTPSVRRSYKVDPRTKQQLKSSTQLYEFRIKGHTIMAHSKKDAIKKLKAQGKIK